MAEKSQIKKSHIPSRLLWPLVFILSVLVIVTISWIGSYFIHYAKQHNYVISLMEGNLTPKNQQTGEDDVSVVVKSDEDGESTTWTTDTAVELFQTSYRNEAGELIAQSDNGDKIVAPGTGGSYTFSIENTGAVNADYQVWLDANVNVSSAGFPLEFRMSDENGWLTDEDGSWKTAEELNQITGKSRLDAGHSSEYTLYWRWPYERESDGSQESSDTEDTTYGNKVTEANGTIGGEMNVSQSISYTLTLHTQATEATDDDNSGTDVPIADVPVTEVPVTETPVTEAPATVTPPAGSQVTDIPGTDDSGAYDDNSGEDSNWNPAQKREDNISVYAVKTGDSTNMEIWILLLVIAGGVILLESYYNISKKKKNHEK